MSPSLTVVCYYNSLKELRQWVAREIAVSYLQEWNGGGLVTKSCLTLATPSTVAC